MANKNAKNKKVQICKYINPEQCLPYADLQLSRLAHFYVLCKRSELQYQKEKVLFSFLCLSFLLFIFAPPIYAGRQPEFHLQTVYSGHYVPERRTAAFRLPQKYGRYGAEKSYRQDFPDCLSTSQERK